MVQGVYAHVQIDTVKGLYGATREACFLVYIVLSRRIQAADARNCMHQQHVGIVPNYAEFSRHARVFQRLDRRIPHALSPVRLQRHVSASRFDDVRHSRAMQTVWVYRVEERGDYVAVQCAVPHGADPCGFAECRIDKDVLGKSLVVTLLGDATTFLSMCADLFVPDILVRMPEQIAKNYRFQHHIEETPADFLVTLGKTAEGSAYLLTCKDDAAVVAEHLSDNSAAYGCVVWAFRNAVDIALYVLGCSFANAKIDFIYQWIEIEWKDRFWGTDTHPPLVATLSEARTWFVRSIDVADARLPVFAICSVDLETTILDIDGTQCRTDLPLSTRKSDVIIIIGYVVGVFDNGVLRDVRKNVVLYDPDQTIQRSDIRWSVDVNVRFATTEHEAVLMYTDDVRECLVVTGWNINSYDCPFLVGSLFGSKDVPRATFQAAKSRFWATCRLQQYYSRFARDETVLFRDRHQLQVDGIAVKNIYIKGVVCDSSLESTARAVLNEGKHDVSFYDMGRTWNRIFAGNIVDRASADADVVVKCVDYCIRDAELAVRIVVPQLCMLLGMQLSLSLEDLTYTMSTVPFLEPNLVFSSVFKSDNNDPQPFSHEKAMYGAESAFTRLAQMPEPPTYKGGYVFQPMSGLQTGTIFECDVNSMYVSLMLLWNLVADLSFAVHEHVGERMMADHAYTAVFNFTPLREFKTIVVSLRADVVARNNVKSNVRTFLLQMISERAVFKTMIVEEKRKGARADKSKLFVLDGLQNDRKLHGNSLYGKQGKAPTKRQTCKDVYSSMFQSRANKHTFNILQNRRVAAAITALGRDAIQSLQDYLATKNDLRVVLGDTDSVSVITERIYKPSDVRTAGHELINDINAHVKEGLSLKLENAYNAIATGTKKSSAPGEDVVAAKKRYVLYSILDDTISLKGDKRVHHRVRTEATRITQDNIRFITAFQLLWTILDNTAERQYHNVDAVTWRPRPDVEHDMLGYLTSIVCTPDEFRNIQTHARPLYALQMLVRSWVDNKTPPRRFRLFDDLKALFHECLADASLVKTTTHVKKLSAYANPPNHAILCYEERGVGANSISYITTVPEKAYALEQTSVMRPRLVRIPDGVHVTDNIPNLKATFGHCTTLLCAVYAISSARPEWVPDNVANFDAFLHRITLEFRDAFVADNTKRIVAACNAHSDRLARFVLNDDERPFGTDLLYVAKKMFLWPKCSSGGLRQNTLEYYFKRELSSVSVTFVPIDVVNVRASGEIVVNFLGSEWDAFEVARLLAAQRPPAHELRRLAQKRAASDNDAHRQANAAKSGALSSNAAFAVGTLECGHSTRDLLNVLLLVILVLQRGRPGCDRSENISTINACNANHILLDTPLGYFFFTEGRLSMHTHASRTCATFLETFFQ